MTILERNKSALESMRFIVYGDEERVKNKAWNITTKAIKTGKLIRPKLCQICSLERGLQAHHKDYTKPLEVEWLCSKCHTRKHRPLFLKV